MASASASASASANASANANVSENVGVNIHINKLIRKEKTGIFIMSKDFFEDFLINLLDNNILYLDKYLIKLLCFYFLYRKRIVSGGGSYEKEISEYENVFKTLLYVPDEFVISKNKKKLYGLFKLNELAYLSEDIEIELKNFILFLTKFINAKVQDIYNKLQDKTLNKSSNEAQIIINLTHIDGKLKPILFAYNIIDTSEAKLKRIKKVINKKLSNNQLFHPALIYRYLTDSKHNRLELYHILTQDNIRLFQRLVFQYFVDDCMFNHQQLHSNKRYHRQQNIIFGNRNTRLRFANTLRSVNSINTRKNSRYRTKNTNGGRSGKNFMLTQNEKNYINKQKALKYPNNNNVNAFERKSKSEPKSNMVHSGEVGNVNTNS